MRQINIQALVDNARFNAFHGVVLFWCALIILFDGYDLAVAGIALPSIMKDMNVGPTKAGFMVSSALIGMALGAIVLGTIADRIGRRWTIAACIAIFSIFTAAAGLAKDPTSFAFLRFLAGIGIGGVMPNVVAHTAEFSPRKLRATLVTIMFSGYPVGGMLAAILGKGLIESHGWQSVFLAAGFPILLIPLIFKSLPESISFLFAKGRHDELKAMAARIDPACNPMPDDRLLLPAEGRPAGTPLVRLFRDGRGFSTVMLWLANLMCLFMVYALSSWLAKLMANAGYSLGSALTFVLVLNGGAIIGSIVGGWLADRYHIKRVLVAMCLLAAVSITLLGYPLPPGVLMVVIGLAGASTIGTQIVSNAYAGQYYPGEIRATGLGWALGIGRGGAILAPIIIGLLVSMNLPLRQNFLAMALPGLVAMVAILLTASKHSAAHHGAQNGSASLGATADTVQRAR